MYRHDDYGQYSQEEFDGFFLRLLLLLGLWDPSMGYESYRLSQMNQTDKQKLRTKILEAPPLPWESDLLPSAIKILSSIALAMLGDMSMIPYLIQITRTGWPDARIRAACALLYVTGIGSTLPTPKDSQLWEEWWEEHKGEFDLSTETESGSKGE